MMTLIELSYEYKEHAEAISLRLKELRLAAKEQTIRKTDIVWNAAWQN